MTINKKMLLFSLGTLAISSIGQSAFGQESSSGKKTNDMTADKSLRIDEIMVTARRMAENLQEVPASLNVVTSESIDNLKLTEFTDLEAVVPGLTLTQDGSGTQTSASLRGVTFDASTTSPPTVAMYLNDAPVQSLFLYDSLFDVGQIEVLRGPQGTTRGISAPSGAITVTTRKPDVTEWGGYAKGQMTDQAANNAQAGINIPIVPNTLAMRLSGVVDKTEANGVKSINNTQDPEQKTTAGRMSLLFEASEDFRAEAAYTYIDKRLKSYEQVSGPGQGTNFSRAIKPGQRRSVQDDISDVDVNLDILTARIDASVFGHDLTYVGSYQEARTYALSDNDAGDILPGVTIPFLTTSAKNETTHEIRFSSKSDTDRIFDYTVGAFYDSADTSADVNNPGPLLPGVFGTPATVDLTVYDPRYQIPIYVDIDYLSKETSVFGSMTLRLGDSTEVTAGLRHIWSKFNSDLGTQLGDGLVTIPPSFIDPNLPSCAAAMLGSTYPGFCDVTIPGSTLPTTSFRAKETPTIYNIAVSHMLNDDLMLYATTGTSYRPPISSPGIQGDLAGNPDPLLNTLTFHPYETSTNYESGFKWTTLDGRARLNASVFYQEFKDLTLYVPNINYYNTLTNQTASANFTASVDAVVTGFEIDAGVNFGRFDLSGQLSYANGDVDGSEVPCNIEQGGTPIFNTANLISFCPGGSVSRDPLWGATLQGEYTIPLKNGWDTYMRALVSYRAKNENKGVNFVVDAYTTTNLYMGLRSQDNAWEISGFVRNLFDTQETLERSNNAYDLNGSLGQSFGQLIPTGGSGYFNTQVTRPREIGISVSYAWGSR